MTDDHPRPRPTRAFRELIYDRSGGQCQREGCDRRIELETFHVAHLRARVHGGPLHESNAEAWCQPCNYAQGPRDAGDSRVTPRLWQLEALDRALSSIARGGAATISAAPGAGKTVFAGLAFEALRDLGLVDRMVVLAPRRTLVTQWAEKLTAQRHIELKPHSAIERRGQAGVVVTYQSLANPDALEVHQAQAERGRTLLVLDEVHHVGERPRGELPAWARSVARLAGNVAGHDLHVAAILNLSGTLWRSAQDERISTVLYRTLDDSRLESLVDFEVTVEELVGRGELRPIDLYRLGAQVRLSDYQSLETVTGDMSDLDEQPSRAVMASLSSMSQWRTAFVSSVLNRLEAAHKALNGHHVKALIVAHRQEAAADFRDEVNRQMQERGLQPFAEIATTDEPDAQQTLDSFRRQKKVGVLCTVDMAGEGYDCPDIAVIGWASNKLTSLYVRQVTARAMRVADVERKLGYVIPAAVVIPDIRELVDQLVSYLAPYTHEVLVPTQEELERQRGEEPARQSGAAPMLAFPRYVLEEARPDDTETVTIALPDGSHEDVDADAARRLAAQLERFIVPGIFTPRIIAASKATVSVRRAANPFSRPGSDVAVLERLATGVQAVQVAGVTRSSSIEDQALILQGQVDTWARWWQMQGDSPAAHFNRTVNEQAGIRDGKRAAASVEQLTKARDIARGIITSYCERTGVKPPRGAR
jgi:superfamily II DNA or RNA helicase